MESIVFSHIFQVFLRPILSQEELERVCGSVGELLAEFHARYADPSTGEPSYHTDFHPSNVLYEAVFFPRISFTGYGYGHINYRRTT